MEVLKATFGPREPGTNWQIVALDSLQAHPVTAQKLGLSRVKDWVHLAGERSFGPISYYLGQSIVPIVALSNDLSWMKCIGTGFFVSCSGLLVTAAHVIADPIESDYAESREVSSSIWQSDVVTLGVMVPSNPIMEPSGYVFRHLEWATFLAEKADSPLPFGRSHLKLNADIAICKVQQPEPRIPYQPLALIQKGINGFGASVGKDATAIGYGEMRDHIQLKVNGHQVICDLPFQLNISTGVVLEHFVDNAISRASPSPGPCFSASLPLPPGMSGSPIFDHEGIYVHGVASMGLSDSDGPTDHGYGSMLAHAIHMPIAALESRSLADITRAGDCGMMIMQGPGDI
ncbi:serine protease [Xanthomonas nasturtii]|uniref:S1 family peptidase n=1 Tax=Xanthomonas nasturtii TaxID=1843581 RepID=UPI002B22857A|nr:serine protease [Xanthomonas nasturtii]MEA9578205.1 serine protease [Xanthomonas nasturtii]